MESYLKLTRELTPNGFDPSVKNTSFNKLYANLIQTQIPNKSQIIDACKFELHNYINTNKKTNT